MTYEDEVVEELIGKLGRIESLADIEKAAFALLKEGKGLDDASAHAIARKVAGYGPLQELMDDPEVEDVMISAPDRVFYHHARDGMLKSKAAFEGRQELEAFVRKLLLFSGKTELGMINDLALPGGARANIVDSPFGPQITIRRFKHSPLSIIDLIESGVMDEQLAAQLWLYTEGMGVRPANILIAGPPAGGKTTLLNALFSFFPANQRTIVIEDTLELNTATEENCSRLVSSDGVGLEALVRNALRMRPDRLVIGEVRGPEAKGLMTAMNIGKFGLGTVHASTAREAVTRLENEPMGVPSELISLIDVIIVISRFARGGAQRRAITEVAETGGVESGKVLLSTLCEFDVSTMSLKQLVPSVSYRDRLAQAARISPKEVMEELERRAWILRELPKRGLRSIADISRFCRRYYENPRGMLTWLGYTEVSK